MDANEKSRTKSSFKVIIRAKKILVNSRKNREQYLFSKLDNLLFLY